MIFTFCFNLFFGFLCNLVVYRVAHFFLSFLGFFFLLVILTTFNFSLFFFSSGSLFLLKLAFKVYFKVVFLNFAQDFLFWYL